MLITEDTMYYYRYKNAQLNKWPCPCCYGIGLKKLEFKAYENNYSKTKTRISLNKEGVFIGVLQCIHEECSCIIAVCGDYTKKQRGDKLKEDYFPKHFNPPIPIFKVGEYDGLSFELFDVINMAFRLFWTDKNACANKIRIAVEQLLTDKNIRKTRTLENPKNGRKTAELSTHRRIELFRKQYPEVADHLLAIKWVGNEGSHAYEGLDEAALLDAFEILEDALETLYGYRKKELQAKIKRINKGKKP